MGRMIPDAEQQEAVDRMVNEPTRAALNASQFGTGKTLVTVEVAKGIGAKIVVVVAPLFTKYSWETTIRAQVDDARVQFINSRKTGKEALQLLLAGEPGYYIVGREYFASKSIRGTLASFSPQIDLLVYDECARWANHKSAGFRIMKTMKPKYRMALSATPYGNKFSGMYAITQWLWPKMEGHASFWRWAATWARTEMGFGGHVQVTGEKNPGAFVSTLPCYVRLEKDFGPVIEQDIEVELSARERAIYDKFEKNLVVFLEENFIKATVPAVKRTRLRQMSLGEVSVDPETDTVYFADDMKSTKLDALLDVVAEYPDEKMLVFMRSQKFARVVAQRMRDAGHRAEEWSGAVSEEERHKIKARFLNDETDYIVATVASIGEGTDGLQAAARMMVWLERDDNNMLNEQAFRRLYRRGQKRQVISLDIVARNTYDRGQLSNLVQQTLARNKSLRKD